MAVEAPKPPSYAGIIKAVRKTKRTANKQQRKALDWARHTYKHAKKLNKDVVADLTEIMDFQMGNAKDVWARYKDTYWELEDEQMAEIDAFQQRAVEFDAEVARMKDEAIQYKSEANQQYQAGKAVAEVGQTFSQERLNAERALTGLGVNPNSGVSQSLTQGIRLAEGAAQAAAGTQAADATRVEGDVRYQAALDRQMQAAAMAESGLAMQAGMVDVGQNYPGTAATAFGQVGTAGAQAVDSTNSIVNTSVNARGLATDWAQVASNNLNTWTDALSRGFTNELDLYKAQVAAEANESSGIGSILGGVAGIAKSFIPAGGLFASTGGAIEPEHEQLFADGGGVGANVSGTGGATGNWTPTGTMAAASQTTDRVPAKLTVGEFVVPKHVVDWKGQEFFQRLIKSAPEQKQDMIAQTGATPQVRTGALPV